MLDISLLGTGGMMPIIGRYLTSLYMQINGSAILVDCGEGTQLALRNAGRSSKDIDVICITHFHADHISGLPGLMLLMGNQGKTSPLTIIGPVGLERIVKSLLVIAPVLPYEVKFIEIDGNVLDLPLSELNADKFSQLRLRAFKVQHKVVCYGYTLELSRLPKFDIAKAQALNIDRRFYGKIQHGETVTVNNKTYTPDMVMGEARKGIKVTYCTDTRPCKSLMDNVKDSDLFICEAMYFDPDKMKDAVEKRHMMLFEATEIAKNKNVKALWLTHFSPSEPKPREYVEVAREQFENTLIPKDGQTIELNFEN